MAFASEFNALRKDWTAYDTALEKDPYAFVYELKESRIKLHAAGA
jgi:hypothetical protein